MLPLGSTRAFADTTLNTDGKEEESDEEVLEVEKPDGNGNSPAELMLFLNGTIYF